MLVRRRFRHELIGETRKPVRTSLFLFLILFSLSSCLILAVPAFAREARFFIGLRNYWLDGDSKAMDVAPFIKDGRTYIPLRYAAYAVGASENNIFYADGQATIIKGDRVLRVTVGSRTMLITGKQVTMDVAPILVGGRIMVPIRWIAESLGVSVRWDQLLQTVVLISEENGDGSHVSPVSAKELREIRWKLPDQSVTTREFAWVFEGLQWKWRIQIPKKLHAYYANLRRAPPGFLSVYVTDPTDDYFISAIAAELKRVVLEEDYTPRQAVEFVATFVQSIRYDYDSNTKGVEEYPDYPVEFLVDQKGDCEDHTILLAAILEKMDYRVVLFEPPGHAALGVAGVDLPGWGMEYQGVRYYYLETTATGWILGECPKKYQDIDAYIHPLLPRPVLTHKWTSKSTGGGWLKLEVEVYNDGSATARDTRVYAFLDRGGNLVWNHCLSDPLDLGPHSKGFYTLFLKLPSNVYTRLVVQTVSEGHLEYESVSDWFNT